MDHQIIARYNNTILHEAMQRYGEYSRSIIKTGISSDVIIFNEAGLWGSPTITLCLSAEPETAFISSARREVRRESSV